MKKTLIVMLLSLFMGAAFMAPAFAGGWGRGGERGCGPGGCDGPCASRDLDGDLVKGRREFREQARELRQQLFEKKGAYHEVLEQDNPSKEEAAKLWSEIFDLKNKMRKMVADAGFGSDKRHWREGGDLPCGSSSCGKGPRGCGASSACDNRPCGASGCGNASRNCEDRPCGATGNGNGPSGCDTPRGCDGPKGRSGRGCNGPGPGR